MKNLGISPMQAGILYILSASDKPMPLNEIAAWVFREPPTVTEIITRMENQKLVKRIRARGKKNTVGVIVTQKGKEILRRQDEQRQAVEDIMTVLTKDETENLKVCLMKLREKALSHLITKPELPFPLT